MGREDENSSLWRHQGKTHLCQLRRRQRDTRGAIRVCHNPSISDPANKTQTRRVADQQAQSPQGEVRPRKSIWILWRNHQRRGSKRFVVVRVIRYLWPQRVVHKQPIIPISLIVPHYPAPPVAISANLPRPGVQALCLQVPLQRHIHAEGARIDT